MQQSQLYDDRLGFEENKAQGPFGDYANDDFTYKNKGEPQYNFFGMPVYSPFGIAAGPLTSPRFIRATLNKGFDIVTLKSVRTSSFPVNSYPHVRPVKAVKKLTPNTKKITTASRYAMPLAAANSFGIPSVAPQEWQKDMRKSLTLVQKGQAVVAAFQGTARGAGRQAFIEDHVRGVELIKKTGANIIEINLSCPNEGKATLACFDIDITSAIVSAVRQTAPDIKLIIKLAYFSDDTHLGNLLKKIGSLVDGISAINNIAVPVVNEKGDAVFSGRKTAGVSGAPIKWAGLDMTRRLSKWRQKYNHSYKIIGIGGVLSAEDFHEYKSSGADFVMSVTGAMWQPGLAAEIKKSL